MEDKDHKFIIEVRLRYEAPEGKTEPQPSKPQVPQGQVQLDPRILNSLLQQLPHALAAMQPKPAGQPPKPTGQPPKAGQPPRV